MTALQTALVVILVLVGCGLYGVLFWTLHLWGLEMDKIIRKQKEREDGTGS